MLADPAAAYLKRQAAEQQNTGSCCSTETHS